MDTTLLASIVGVLFIIIGYFIKNNFHSYLKGSSSQASNKDVISLEVNERLSNYSIIYGFATLFLFLISCLLNWEKYIFTLWVISLIVILIIMALTSHIIHRKYHKKSKGKIIAIAIVALTAILILLMYLILREPNVKINNKGIEINSVQGEYIPRVAIKEVRLIDMIPPKIELHEGFDIFGVSRGVFKLESWERVDLYLQSQRSPYIYIEMTSGRIVIFNSANKVKTKDYYKSITEICNHSFSN